MKIIDLDQLGWGVKSHLSALWWLGLLYRRPRLVKEKLGRLNRRLAGIKGVMLYWHALPYSILLVLGGSYLVFGLLGLLHLDFSFIAVGIAYGITVGITVGIAGGIAFGIAFGIAGGIAGGIAFGIAYGITVGIVFGIPGSIAFGIAGGIALGIAFGIAFGIAVGIAIGIAVGIAFGIACGIVFGIIFGIVFGIADGLAVGIAVGIVFGIVSPRLYYYPVHLLLTWPRARLRWFDYHPAIWDEMCGAPYKGLHRLLVAKAMADPSVGNRHIDYLIDHYPAQRMEALTARTVLGIRRMAEVARLGELGAIAARLPEGSKGFLNKTAAIRQAIEEISQEQIRLDAIDRPAFREPFAKLVREKIQSFYERVNGYPEPFRTEYRAAALQWLGIAEHHLEQIQRVTTRSLTTQVFRAGDPVDMGQEAFVPRSRVIDTIAQQALMANGCPGIVLYARRRMGKSTMLRNLGNFLPTGVGTIVFSMQHPGYFTSLSLFTSSLGEEIRKNASLDLEIPTDLLSFMALLEACNRKLEKEGRRLILGIDEYEAIDSKIGEGVFTEDLLSTLRESIQSHRQLTWIFAGSHHITELEHADWTSYLVSARTIEIPLFTLAETRLLLTEPLKYSTLWPQDAPGRPRFDASFWGADGIDRIHNEAAGWPHLVQLIAETAIDVLNSSSEETSVTTEILNRAIDGSIVSGQVVLSQLLKGESRLPGEWDYLLGFKRGDTQPPPQDDKVAQSLRRRMIVLEEEGNWRLRVPLMLKWLRRRA
jgi:hypothetical protein